LREGTHFATNSLRLVCNAKEMASPRSHYIPHLQNQSRVSTEANSDGPHGNHICHAAVLSRCQVLLNKFNYITTDTHTLAGTYHPFPYSISTAAWISILHSSKLVNGHEDIVILLTINSRYAALSRLKLSIFSTFTRLYNKQLFARNHQKSTLSASDARIKQVAYHSMLLPSSTPGGTVRALYIRIPT